MLRTLKFIFLCITLFASFLFTMPVHGMISNNKIFDAVTSKDKGNENFIENFFANGKNKNRLGIWQMGTYSLLHLAALNSTKKMVRILLDAGIPIDIKNDEKETALHMAAQTVNHDIVAFLIEKGANVNAKTADGRTPLHYAAENGESANVKVLIDAGASPLVKDTYNKTPAERACSWDTTKKAAVIAALKTPPSKPYKSEKLESPETSIIPKKPKDSAGDEHLKLKLKILEKKLTKLSDILTTLKSNLVSLKNNLTS